MQQEFVKGSLTFERLQDAVRGNIAAIRSVTTLMPAGGAGDKVFPPTYEGGKYAVETRHVGGEEVATVLLDSVQSQANRMELALLAAYRRGELGFPLLSVDFGKEFPDIGEITSLEAPHRIADAIFRDSLFDGKPFRESGLGERFTAARINNATALLELCPTALIFGVWDSTGAQGGLGAKFERVIVSEIVGYQSTAGVRTSSRIDPLGIQKVEIYKAGSQTERWTLDEATAEKAKNAKPKTLVPSDVNHGNVTPTINEIGGGVTISHAVQTTVVSLVALRRLRFPSGGSVSKAESDVAARTLLASLALAAVANLRDEGYDLRSRCLLVPDNAPLYEMVPSEGSTPIPFSLSAHQAAAIFAGAVADASRFGLPWLVSKISLQPSPKLIQLIKKSRAKTTAEQE